MDLKKLLVIVTLSGTITPLGYSVANATCLTHCEAKIVEHDCSDPDIAYDPCEGREGCHGAITRTWPAAQRLRVAIECITSCCSPPFEGQEAICTTLLFEPDAIVDRVAELGDLAVLGPDGDPIHQGFDPTDQLCGERAVVYELEDRLGPGGTYQVRLDRTAGIVKFEVVGPSLTEWSGAGGCSSSGTSQSSGIVLIVLFFLGLSQRRLWL